MTTFFKMQAQGNDYIYFDLPKEQEWEKNWHEISVILSNRHFGIGGDGVVLILPSQIADAKMKMFNADGSEAEMCGSALRCIGYYVFKKRNCKQIFIETKAGIKKVLIDDSQNPVMVSAEMGVPECIKAGIVEVAGISGYKVLAGNPHFVCFQDSFDSDRLNQLGKELENHSEFPDGTNIEFIKVKNSKEIDIYFWERGSGNTLACGTGAISAFFISRSLQLVDAAVVMNMPGGKVTATFSHDNYWLCGSVQMVFQGEVKI